MEYKRLKKKKNSFLLSFFSIYGNSFPLYYQKHTKYSSSLGIFLGILSIIIILLLIIHNIIFLFNHSIFDIISLNNYKINQTLNFSEIPIMIKLTSDKKISDYSINVYKKNYNILNSNIIIDTYPIYIESCNDSSYKEKFPEMKQFSLSEFICIRPNQNLSIYNNYNDIINGFETFNIVFNVNKTNLHLNNTFISIIFLNNNIDHFNYNNPIQYMFDNKNFKIEYGLTKKFIFYFSSILYENDIGFISKKYKSFNSFKFQELLYDSYINYNNEFNIFNNNSLLEIEFSCNNKELKYIRKNLKFQDFFSKIGGFIFFLTFLFQKITIYFSSKSLILNIINTMIYQNLSKVEVKKDIRKLSKCVNIHNLSRNVLNNSTHNLLFFKRLSCNFNKDDKNSYNKNLLISFNTFNNSYLKSKSQMEKKGISISFINYFIPLSCLRHYKKYDFLIVYNNILTSFLSIEKILPVVERGYTFFYDKGNDSSFQKGSHNIFKIIKDDNYIFSKSQF